MANARVTFRSSKSGSSASGVTDQYGLYKLGGDGVEPGEYDVIVNELRYRDGKAMAPTVAIKYINPQSSGLKFTAEPGGEKTFDLVLDPP